jgi:hypothetical protein
LSEFFIGHLLVTSGDIHAGDLLELPFNRGFNIIEFSGEWFLMGDWLGEHTDSVKYWSKNDWDLLNQSISGEENCVLLGPLLDEFLVLVEFLEVVKSGDFNVEVLSSDLISVFLIGDQTDFHLWSWDVWKSD